MDLRIYAQSLLQFKFLKHRVQLRIPYAAGLPKAVEGLLQLTNLPVWRIRWLDRNAVTTSNVQVEMHP